MLPQRRAAARLHVDHPGGPLWKNKDTGAWSIPKGEYGPEEDALTAARRECEEETGLLPEGPFLELRPVKLRSGKIVRRVLRCKEFHEPVGDLSTIMDD